ncbi:SHPRH [Bugula neritina]|uniref:SHPRH n=1 Tax=Bugula neritina TaxID=10212 RepID=A0A7J7JHW9_BUGNE|nr:SHPRH [Bugula neritina]
MPIGYCTVVLTLLSAIISSSRINIIFIVCMFLEVVQPFCPELPSDHHDLDILYSAIKEKSYLSSTPTLQLEDQLQEAEEGGESMTRKRNLLAKLRRYQVDAVKWMLCKERGLHDEAYTKDVEKLFPQFHSNLHGNLDSGILTERPPRLQLSPGGILADEMGLGKTVEVLACMVCNPRRDLSPTPLLHVGEHCVVDAAAKSFFNRLSKREDGSLKAAGFHETVNIVNVSNEAKEGVILRRPTLRTCNAHPIEISNIYETNLDTSAVPLTDSTSVAVPSTDSPSVALPSTDSTPVAVPSTDSTSVALPSTDSTAVAVPSTDSTSVAVPSTDSTAVAVPLTYSTSVAVPSTDSAAVAVPSTDSTSVAVPTADSTSLAVPSTDSTSVAVPSTDSTSVAVPSTDSTSVAVPSIDSSSVAVSSTDSTSVAVPSTDSTSVAVPSTNSTSVALPSTDSTSVAVPTADSTSLAVPSISEAQHPAGDSEMIVSVSSISAKFECTCGQYMVDEVKVQCSVCAMRQHAFCVRYDVTDPGRGAYKCPHCHAASKPIKSGATLIVTPSSISHQWREEIHKHIGSSGLKVLEYEGVSPTSGYVQPMTLAAQDIVITTYNVLRAELKTTNVPHSNSDSGRRLRKPKKFLALPSPLTAVQWWRICLDEAQMVESVASATSEMALKLSAVNRWCVTGTPINTSAYDLYGLFLFLSVHPFSVKSLWEGFFYWPYCFGLPNNLHTVLRHVMWRTCKNDVRDQLGLPDQHTIMHEVMFSAIEEFYYRQMYSSCKTDFQQIYSKYPDKSVRLDSLSPMEVNKLLLPFINMRKSCCYPELCYEQAGQVRTVRWERRANASRSGAKAKKKVVTKSNLTMQQLMQRTIKKVKVSCEDAHRSIVAGLNGQASGHLMREEYSEAVLKYLEVLNPSTVYEDVRTDTLQLIHATHNLRHVLLLRRTPEHQHIDTEKLERDEQELRDKFLEKSLSAVNTVTSNYQTLLDTVCEDELMTETFDDSNCYWHNLFLLADCQTEDLLSEALVICNRSQVTVDFYSLQGLSYYLTSKWSQLVSAYKAATEAVEALLKVGFKDSLVKEVVTCCIRPDFSLNDSECHYCWCERMLKILEYQLFDFSQRTYIDEDGEEQRKGTWAPSVTECLLKAVISHYRRWRSREPLCDDTTCEVSLEIGAKHLKLIDNMKKHFKTTRNLWMALKNRVAAFDELAMATIRFRLRESWEDNSDTPSYVLSPDMLDAFQFKQKLDEQAGRDELSKQLRQLNYLKHVDSQPIDPITGNTQLCPICQQHLGHSWAVLVCCHSFCMTCVAALASHSLFVDKRRFRCAVCRELTRLTDISHVSSGHSIFKDSDIEVEGDYSSKVKEVIRCLKAITREDPEAKVLLFSSWITLLEIVRNGLVRNSIPFSCLYGNKGVRNYKQKVLNRFTRSLGMEVLLLPLSSGANGLNLTEATHVILLEPLLNPGKEAQAIGRIHRIGQTKQTYVHKFIVKHTIEEKVHSIMSKISQSTLSASASLDELPLTLADLNDMFE